MSDNAHALPGEPVLPAAIMVSLGLARARKVAGRARCIAGLPLLVHRRRRTAGGTASARFGELPWATQGTFGVFWCSYAVSIQAGFDRSTPPAFRPGTKPAATGSAIAAVPATDTAMTSDGGMRVAALRSDAAHPVPDPGGLGRSPAASARCAEQSAALAGVAPALVLWRRGGRAATRQRVAKTGRISPLPPRLVSRAMAPLSGAAWLVSMKPPPARAAAVPASGISSGQLAGEPALPATPAWPTMMAEAQAVVQGMWAPSAAQPASTASLLASFTHMHGNTMLPAARPPAARSVAQDAEMSDFGLVSLPWETVQGGRAGLADAPVAPSAAGQTFALPAGQPQPVDGLLVLAETLKTLFRRELADIADRVAKIDGPKQNAAPRPAAAPTEDALARRMLGNIRAILQEERFRSGKLR